MCFAQRHRARERPLQRDHWRSTNERTDRVCPRAQDRRRGGRPRRRRTPRVLAARARIADLDPADAVWIGRQESLDWTRRTASGT